MSTDLNNKTGNFNISFPTLGDMKTPKAEEPKNPEPEGKSSARRAAKIRKHKKTRK